MKLPTQNNSSTGTNYNYALLNVISPSGLDFDNTSISMGDNYGAMYFLCRYPDEPDYGWLSALSNIEGTATSIEWRYTDSAPLTDVYDKKISQYRGELPTIKEQSSKDIMQKKIDDLDKLIRKLSINNEPVGYMNILFYIMGNSKEDYENRLKRVRSIVATSKGSLKLIKYRQSLALSALAPYGIPDTVISAQGDRNMPVSTFFGGFPMANAGINDIGGVYLGKTKGKKLVILNDWLRGKDRINSNWLITGQPGSGKSSTIKALFIKERAVFGTRFIVLDAEEEYIHLAKHSNMQGDVIDCTSGINGRINPLQVRPSPRITRDDFASDEEYEEALASGEYAEYKDEGHGTGDLALYLQNLRRFLRMYLGSENFTQKKKVRLEKLLIELYEKFQITWETDVSRIPNEEFPVFSDLYSLVEEHLKSPDISTRDRDIYEDILDDLFSITKGADSFIWNGPTTIKADSGFTAINCSKLLEADDNVKRAAFYNIQLWAWQQMSANRTEKVVFAEDEGYLFVDPEYPELMQMSRNISKRSRKYEGALWFITHSVVDILDPAVKRFGQAIIDNACYKLLMGCDGKNLEESAELFRLTDTEKNILESKQRGRGILIAGATRLELNVDIRPAFLEMFGKAGGR